MASQYRFLQGVLNALAGTSGCGAQGAANAYAGSTGLGTVAALNYANGWRSGGTKPYLGLWAVCNALAGTTGLGPVQALGVLSQTAFDQITHVAGVGGFNAVDGPQTLSFTTVGKGNLLTLCLVTRFPMTGAITGIVDTGATPLLGVGAWKKVVDQAADVLGAAGNYGYTSVWQATVSAVGTFIATVTASSYAGISYVTMIDEYSSEHGPRSIWTPLAVNGTLNSNVSAVGQIGPSFVAPNANCVYVGCVSTANAPTANPVTGITYESYSTGPSARLYYYATSQKAGVASPQPSVSNTGSPGGTAWSTALIGVTAQ